MTTWENISEALMKISVLLGAEWKCRPAENIPSLSAADEALCDEWCHRLGGDLNEPIFPPAHLRPWILMRLAHAAAFAKGLQTNGAPQPDAFSAALVRDLLIPIWHERLQADDSDSLSA